MWDDTFSSSVIWIFAIDESIGWELQFFYVFDPHLRVFENWLFVIGVDRIIKWNYVDAMLFGYEDIGLVLARDHGTVDDLIKRRDNRWNKIMKNCSNLHSNLKSKARGAEDVNKIV